MKRVPEEYLISKYGYDANKEKFSFPKSKKEELSSLINSAQPSDVLVLTIIPTGFKILHNQKLKILDARFSTDDDIKSINIIFQPPRKKNIYKG